ncbi:MAG: beta-lactamase family protein [Gemmatimonadota bacterium]|nr:beta-lactamase family protein [Gemmatimonadota bacterium]
MIRYSALVLAGTLTVIVGIWPRSAQAQVSDAQVERLMQEHSVPGLALAVVTPESTFLSGFGSTSPQGGEQVTPDTPFRLASVAKVLVAATVLTDVRAGGLDLHADISRQVDVPLDGSYTGPVTLHALMTHSAGFDERLVGYAARESADMRRLGDYLAARMPARGWPTGSLVSYSNHGMSLAAYVTENRAGRSFADVARSNVFAPLSMNSTGFLTRGEQVPAGAAEPMSCRDGECRSEAHVFSHAYPAGLAFTTARDMSHFVAAVSSGEDRPAGLTDLVPTRFTNDPRLPGMSYGFFNQLYGGRRVLAHSGTVPGYASLLVIVPEEQIGFFFVTNGGDSAFGAELRDLLLVALLGEAQAPTLSPRRTENPSDRAGAYELTRYSHDTIERFPQVFNNTIQVEASGDSLVIWGERYLQIDDSLYQQVGGEKLIAFGAREGKSYLFRPSDVYGAMLPAAYERRKTTPYFLNEYASWLFGLPILLLLVGWPLLLSLGYILRRRRGEDRPAFHPISFIAASGALLASVLFAWFGFGFVALSNRLFQSGELFFGMPDALASMTWIPPVHAVLTGLLALAVIGAWKDGWWTVSRRILYTTLVAILLLQVSFHLSWNYLPVAW